MAGFAVGSALLAYAPIKWLISTWQDPSYQSSGALYLLIIIGLLIWSLSSPKLGGDQKNRFVAVGLLLAAALLRLISPACRYQYYWRCCAGAGHFCAFDVAHAVRPTTSAFPILGISVVFVFPTVRADCTAHIGISDAGGFRIWGPAVC